MKWPRRKFPVNGLAVGGALATGAATWAGLSDSRRARFVRQLLTDLKRPVPPAPMIPRPAQWDDHRLTFAWLGHATVLINFYGLRILTDPTFFDHIGIDTWLGTFGPKRQVQCALKPGQLADIDVLLLSH